jgi:hypothetical protein
MAPQFPMNHKAACGEAATEEAELVQEMRQYFVQAKGHAGGIRFDNAGLWSKNEWVSGSRRFRGREQECREHYRAEGVIWRKGK